MARAIDQKQWVKEVSELEVSLRKSQALAAELLPFPWHPVQLLLEAILLGWIYYSCLEWELQELGCQSLSLASCLTLDPTGSDLEEGACSVCNLVCPVKWRLFFWSLGRWR